MFKSDEGTNANTGQPWGRILISLVLVIIILIIGALMASKRVDILKLEGRYSSLGGAKSSELAIKKSDQGMFTVLATFNGVTTENSIYGTRLSLATKLGDPSSVVSYTFALVGSNIVFTPVPGSPGSGLPITFVTIEGYETRLGGTSSWGFKDLAGNLYAPPPWDYDNHSCTQCHMKYLTTSRIGSSCRLHDHNADSQRYIDKVAQDIDLRIRNQRYYGYHGPRG